MQETQEMWVRSLDQEDSLEEGRGHWEVSETAADGSSVSSRSLFCDYGQETMPQATVCPSPN